MYTLTFDPQTIDYLEKLERSLKKRIFEKLLATKEHPHHYFERLEGRRDYKLRVGDYRIIADIDNQHKRIHVTVIGHRKNVYN